MAKSVFILLFMLCMTPLISPPIALVLGIAIALFIGHPYLKWNAQATKLLLQISVVGLGFGLNLGEILKVGSQGVSFTFISIFGTLLLGYFIGRWLKIQKRTSHLISSGTAICGGSAIAAVGPIINADSKEMSASLGTVFILNSIALLIFPIIGHFFHLSQNQFGFWAAIAIHDTSSVVGAAAKYGAVALKIATTVKLARALWIIPIAFLTAFLFKNKTEKIAIPYFILLFVIASILRTYFAPIAMISPEIVFIAKTGLTVTLFLIGAGLSKDVIKSIGVKPLIQGIILWVVISIASLLVVINFIK